jgi:hypothetical protein
VRPTLRPAWLPLEAATGLALAKEDVLGKPLEKVPGKALGKEREVDAGNPELAAGKPEVAGKEPVLPGKALAPADIPLPPESPGDWNHIPPVACPRSKAVFPAVQEPSLPAFSA